MKFFWVGDFSTSHKIQINAQKVGKIKLKFKTFFKGSSILTPYFKGSQIKDGDGHDFSSI